MSESESTGRPDAKAVMQHLRPLAARLEEARQSAITSRNKARLVSLCIGAVAWLAALLVFSSGEYAAAGGLIAGALGTLLAVMIYQLTGARAKDAYLQRFKCEFLAEAVSVAVPGMSYSPGSMVPESAFRQGGLFSSRIDRYHGEDAFRGTAGATELLFSELHVERKETSRDSKGRTRTRWVTVFKGIYMIADFHKEFSARVEIVPDIAEAGFGWIGRKLQGFGGDLVRLESPEFEKAFKVTSSDALAARYLLTPDMQERFLTLRRNWSPGIRAVLVNSLLHLAIPKTDDWFEPSLDTPADDLAALHTFLFRMTALIGITETLDLNTRIWSKQ